MLRRMRENDVRRALAAGESPIGLMIFEYGTTGIARMCRTAGADFVLYDMEHSGWTPETLKVLLETARAAGITPFVRVRDSQRSSVSLLLDLGALGLMIPMVESADQARRIVDYARYAPAGSRGVAVYHADDIEPEGLPATLAKANREIVLMAQIETVAGVEQVEEIAAVDGIDLLWIGHFDLTTSLGTPGAFWNDAHTAAVERVMRAAAAAGKPVGSLANDVADARRLLAMGFRVILLGDSPVFGAALTSALADVRAD
jgi:2-keto-3-deoxy-L-rhamnonate aldolase RhmA